MPVYDLTDEPSLFATKNKAITNNIRKRGVTVYDLTEETAFLATYTQGRDLRYEQTLRKAKKEGRYLDLTTTPLLPVINK